MYDNVYSISSSERADARRALVRVRILCVVLLHPVCAAAADDRRACVMLARSMLAI